MHCRTTLPSIPAVFDPLLRPVKDAALAPVARRLRALPPALLTGAGVVAGLGAAGAAWQEEMGLGLGLWILNRLLDGLDGLVARAGGRASDLGGLLDLVADFLVYAAIPLAMGFRPGAPAGLDFATAILLAAFYVNAAAWMVPAALLERRLRGALERGEPTSVVIPEGIVSGGETVVFYGLFFVLPDHQRWLFLVMAALTGVTVVQRLVWARREFGGAR